MTKHRVLLIGTEPERMTRLKRTYKSLLKMGIDVTVFRPTMKPRGSPRLLKGIIRYAAIGFQLLFSKADVYHFYNVPDIIGIFLVPKRGTKIYDVRSPWFSSVKEMIGINLFSKIAGFIERLLTRSADVVLTANTPLAERAQKWGAHKVVVVPNYPPNDFAPTRERDEMRDELKLGSQKTVLYLGKISRLEGSELLKQIISRCLSDETVSFLVLGDGPAKSSLERFLQERGFTERVRMIDWVPHHQVANYISAADICILPREWTSFSPYTSPENILKVGEYLAVGKPVVVPRMGGFVDAQFPVIAVEPAEMGQAVLDYFANPRPASTSDSPSWVISEERLREVYMSLGVLS